MAYHKFGRGWIASVYDLRTGKRQSRSCDTKEDAEEVERKNRVERRQVRLGLVTPLELELADRGRTPASEVLDAQIEDMRPRVTAGHLKYHEKAVRAILDGISAAGPINQLDGEAVRRWIDRRRKDGGSPRTVNRYINAIRSLCSWAVERRYLDASPVETIRPMQDRAGVRCKRVLTIAEAASLTTCEAIPPARRDVYLWWIWTGFRPDAETRAVRWSHVKLGEALLEMPPGLTKNRRAVLLPLASPVVAMLARRAADAGIGGPIFASVPTAKTWRADCTAARIAHQTHEGGAYRDSCRKTFTTRLAEAGVPTDIRMRLVRHSIKSITERIYTAKTPAMLDQERAALEQAVAWTSAASREPRREPGATSRKAAT